MNMETFMLMAAAYALEKKSYNAEKIQGLDKASASDFISSLIKDTIYHSNPWSVEAKLAAKAATKVLAGKAIYE